MKTMRLICNTLLVSVLAACCGINIVLAQTWSDHNPYKKPTRQEERENAFPRRPTDRNPYANSETAKKLQLMSMRKLRAVYKAAGEADFYERTVEGITISGNFRAPGPMPAGEEAVGFANSFLFPIWIFSPFRRMYNSWAYQFFWNGKRFWEDGVSCQYWKDDRGVSDYTITNRLSFPIGSIGIGTILMAGDGRGDFGIMTDHDGMPTWEVTYHRRALGVYWMQDNLRLINFDDSTGRGTWMGFMRFGLLPHFSGKNDARYFALSQDTAYWIIDGSPPRECQVPVFMNPENTSPIMI